MKEDGPKTSFEASSCGACPKPADRFLLSPAAKAIFELRPLMRLAVETFKCSPSCGVMMVPSSFLTSSVLFRSVALFADLEGV